MILVCRPLFTGNEEKYLKECIKSDWVSADGAFVKKLETQFAEYIGMNYGLGVSNGTAALDVGIHALGLKKNDEIIMPSLTIMSCAISTLRNKVKPVIVDVDLDTFCISPQAIEKAITKKTKAIMVVHLFGHSPDMKAIMKIAKKHKLKVIEDCSQSVGVVVNNKKLGSFGDIATFSLYANKTITSGEGGMVLFKKKSHKEKAVKYSRLYFGEGLKKFIHEEIGYNFKISNIQAAVGLAQLEKIDFLRNIKIEFAKQYIKELKDLNLTLPLIDDTWLFPIVTPIINMTLINKLSKKGIQSRQFFTGLHKQPSLKGLVRSFKCPNTEYLSQHGLYIPSGAGNTIEEVNQVIKVLKDILK